MDLHINNIRTNLNDIINPVINLQMDSTFETKEGKVRIES